MVNTRSPTTIQDVARLAGTSAATVSNLVNGRTGRLSPATGARITAAIETLGWRPNHAARQLKAGQVQMLGLLVPSMENPFHGAFARLVEEAAGRRGYDVMLFNSLRDAARERRYAETLWNIGVRGVITSSSPLALDHLADLQTRGLHLVAFDRGPDLSGRLSPDTVTMDNRDAGRIATEHLRALGHRRIGFIRGPLDTVNRAERVAGWRDRVGAGSPLWCRGDPACEGLPLGRAAARAMLQRTRPPTALLAINDITALGALAGVRDLGLNVPGDVSVMGIDDIPLAAAAFPSLTTVRQPLPAITEAAVALLTGRLAGDGSPPRSLCFPGELVVRASTAPPRSSR